MAKKAKAPPGLFLAGEAGATLDDLYVWAVGRTKEDAIREWDEKCDGVSDEGRTRVEVFELVRLGEFDVEQETRLIITPVEDD